MTSGEVLNKMQLKFWRSGDTWINSKLVKECAEITAERLQLIIINSGFLTGALPDSLKVDKEIPSFKTASNSDISN